MTSANQESGKTAASESEQTGNKKQERTEVSLDPNPSEALRELATSDETTTNVDESSSKGA